MAVIEEIKQYSKQINILYVEDIREIREDTAAILKNFFDVVDTADNGDNGLTAYGANTYDIVISDVKMPELDGIQMARKIKQINPEQVLVITTAFDDYKTIRNLFDLGFDKFIVKPMNFENLLTVLLDVSKRVYHRKEFLRNRLLTTRLSAMNEILVNIAHHWRQPLNVVGLNVQEIVDSFEHGELSREHMKEIVDSTMQTVMSMSETIDKFSQFCVHSHSGEDFSIDKTINEAIYIAKDTLLAHGIEIIKDVETDSVIKGKQEDLANAALEIIYNGIEAMLENIPDKPFIKIRVTSNNGRPLIVISNNGPLIKDALLSRVHEPYFSTKCVSSGTGLGLYIAKMIVEHNLHGALSYRNIDGCVEFSIAL